MYPKSLVLMLVALAASSSGCCSIYHTYKPVTFRVLDGDTYEPAEGSELRVYYPNMIDFNPPKTPLAKTDASGTATLRIAEYHATFVEPVDEKDRYYSDRLSFKNGEIDALPRKGDGKVRHTFLTYKNGRPQIELIVPDGYRGPVKMHFETEDIPARGKRQFQFTVEPNGHVTIRGPMILSDPWTSRRITAKYANGEKVPSPSQDRPNEIAFRCVHAREKMELYFIDTEEVAKSAEDLVWDRISNNSRRDNLDKFRRYMSE